jgi:L-lactate dehydrogenase
VNAYVLGEHGESQFVAWSAASIGGVALDKAAPPNTFNRTELAEECKHEAQRIIKAKGAIAFGIGSIVASICASILFDKRDVRPVSHYQPNLGCCLSLPAVLGREGVMETVSLPLNAEEKAQLAKSGTIVKEAVQGLDDWAR